MDRDVSDPEPCRSCDALCCRSFPSVALFPGEYETLQNAGARRLYFSLDGRHRLIIENGCEFLVEGRCSIYDNRPLICKRFVCVDL